MFTSIKSKIRKFKSETSGNMTLEAVLVLPLLIWAATGTYTFFDVYKAQNSTYRANYTISDMLSRQTDSIDAAYVEGLFTVFQYMTGSTVNNSWMRISVVACNASCDNEANRQLSFDWSHGLNGAANLTQEDMVYVDDVIPLFSEGDRLILVQTSTDYEPPFSSSLTHFAARTLETDIVTRPRFAPLLAWDGPGPSGSDAADSPNG